MHDHAHHAHGRAPHVLRTHAARKDPTHTTAIRVAFEQDVNARFTKLRRQVRAAILSRDVLGLRTNDTLPGHGAFDFPRDSSKVAAFSKWLSEESSRDVLGVEYGTSVASASASAWSNVYITSAYQRGLSQAASELRGAGVSVSPNWVSSAFLRPMHAERVGLIYTRTYEDLTNVTTEMADQMRAVLALGIAEGRSPLDIADRLTDRIDAIGRSRARTVARTEVISAHAQASLAAYREAGVEGVGVRAEWQTAGDDAVCPECEDMEGQTFTIDEADGMIPLHPNCRCAYVPVVSDPGAVSLGDG